MPPIDPYEVLRAGFDIAIERKGKPRAFLPYIYLVTTPAFIL